MAHEPVIGSDQVRPALTVRLTGEMTQHTAGGIIGAVDQAATGLTASSALVLDLRELGLLSASGVRPLTAAAERYTARGIRCCVVVDLGSPVASVLDAAGVHALLPVFADVEQALAGVVSDVDMPWGHIETLTRALLNTTTVGAALQSVIDATMVAVPAATMASVTLRTAKGEVFTPVQTDAQATELDLVQYRSGRGPCLDAADPRGPAYAESPDLTGERRWPRFSAAAVAAGYRAVHSIELLPGAGSDRLTGGLNIYFRDPLELGDTDRRTVLLLATHASLALAHARSTELADLHDLELRAAIDSRDVIGQAKGILMHRQGISADKAFDLLRGTSQELNVKLVELARNLVARHSELDR
ncbi:ANTAR domain-containing protein [Umezawaea sp. NPDC059074]|uniref:ANTAR domain-containing protein n=1 Tax=Umezawaea sp. NPDC059074 TaxID=3346716 RepID=UPI003694801A